MQAAVITVSDRVSTGAAGDESGPALADMLARRGYEVLPIEVVPDDPVRIAGAIRAQAAVARLVVTTGGTGLAPRDRTPEATIGIADYLVPGIAELIRAV